MSHFVWFFCCSFTKKKNPKAATGSTRLFLVGAFVKGLRSIRQLCVLVPDAQTTSLELSVITHSVCGAARLPGLKLERGV